MTLLCGVVGALIVLFLLTEVFEGLVLPRQVTRPFRLTRLYYRIAWGTWGACADRLPTGRRRDTFLSYYGPLSLLLLFGLWAAGLILGFGLLQYALELREGGLIDALYLSGATFTTLGYGDVLPRNLAARMLAVVEAGTGLGFFAVVISYLPVLYQAFSRRESLISLLDARAGSPPAAGRLLLRLPPAGGGEALLRFLEEGERWAAELLESHLSFPVLGYYRSQHHNESWIAALTCLLDSSALLLTVAEGVDRRQARLTFAAARHAVVDLALVLRRLPETPVADRLPGDRLEELCAALREAGVVVRDDDITRAKLLELRGLYEPFAAGLADHLRLVVPEVWPAEGGPDNWQTSAWMRRAGPFSSLGVDPRDDHFD
jgi:hypothetical protein